MEIGAVSLDVRSAVDALVLFRQIEALDDLAGVVKAEDVGPGRTPTLRIASPTPMSLSTCIELALIWMPAPTSPSAGACS